VGEGDSIQLGPGGEDPLLGDEAVVVALAAVLILDVGDTLVWPLGLIVVVGHALAAGPLAAVVGGDHAIDVHVVTQFYCNHHGEPAGAQPRMGLFLGSWSCLKELARSRCAHIRSKRLTGASSEKVTL